MPHHDNIPIWEVDISVIAPVSIRNEFRFNARKELEHPDPFYSEIQIRENENGFKATITAFAPNPKLAEKAAILFFGRMLDCLSLKLNLPLQLDLSRNVFIPRNVDNVRRRIDRNDFREAFQESRLLSLTETTFLRSLSWFRKGKYTQDPFDKFFKAEVKRLIEATENLKHKTALMVMYSAGLRVGEVVRLKVSDIDSDRMLIRIEQGKGSIC